MEMAPPITSSTGGGGGDDAPDFDYSSCSSSSITAPDSSISDVSFGSSSSISSFCSAADVRTTTVSSSSSVTTRKPHKGSQAEWESIRRLRSLTSGRVALDHFRLVRRLGSGDLGNVYLCRLREPRLSGCLYAMKVVDREALAVRKKLQRAETEREILSMLDHPFLPTLYAHFDAAHYSCFVMEFCPGGDLHVARQRQPGRRFSLSSTRFYAAETLLALEYLHMMGVVYRDLKPENVLVRGDGHIMLSDFDLSLKCDVVPKLLRIQKIPNTAVSGKNSSRDSTTTESAPSSSCVLASPMQPVLSCLLGTGGNSCSRRKTTTIRATAAASKEEQEEDDGGSAEQEDELLKVYDPELVAEPTAARSKSFVGTHEYLAPEVISGLGHGSAVDWWTLGVLLYELLYGRTPFKGEDNENTLINIIKQPLRFPKTTVGSQRELEEMVAAQDLIGKLLVKNPKKRIGSLRGSVEIKRHPFFKGVNWALIRSVKPPEVPMQIISSKNTAISSNISKSKVNSSGVRRRDDTYQLPQHFDYF